MLHIKKYFQDVVFVIFIKFLIGHMVCQHSFTLHQYTTNHYQFIKNKNKNTMDHVRTQYVTH